MLSGTWIDWTVKSNSWETECWRQ